MLCRVCRQVFLDHVNAFVQEELRHHSSFQDLEQAAKQHCEICERLFNKASVISHPVFRPESTSSTKACTVFMIAYREKSHVRFLFRIYDDSRMSTWDRAKHSLTQDGVAFHLSWGKEAVWPGFDWQLPDPALELTSPMLAKTDSTGSISSFARVSRWLEYCAKNHHSCSELDTQCWAPTRLLAVGTESRPVLKLHITQGNQLDRGQRYISLSHRWGSADMKKLLPANVPTFQHGIPEQELPQTYKDAFQIARRLGVPFIWIDSLCIIQDSDDDWRQESKTMGKVYRHAWFNVSADSATDSNTGCFSTRPLSHLAPFRMAECRYMSQSGVLPASVVFEIRIFQDNVSNAPLNKRGWVLQERVLAPRVVHYCAREIFWECHELHACERFPTGLQTTLGTRELLKSNTFCTQNTEALSHLQVLPGPATKALLRWKEIVNVYSSCALTKEEDKLIAISGLATEMQKILGNDKYLAGLWRSQLLADLCWTVISDSTRPKSYRAPSWSWASLDGEVGAGDPRPHSYPFKDIHLGLKILNAETTLVDENLCGQVSGGFLKIQGKTKVLEWDSERHKRVLRDAVSKAITEVVDKHREGSHDTENPASHYYEVLIDSSEDPWIEEAHMVPVHTYYNQNSDFCSMEGLLLAGTDTANLRRFGVFKLDDSKKNLVSLLDSLSEALLTIY
jgi:hypothetical protein